MYMVFRNTKIRNPNGYIKVNIKTAEKVVKEYYNGKMETLL